MFFFGHGHYLAMVFTMLIQPLYGNGILDNEMATFQQRLMQLLFSYYLAMVPWHSPRNYVVSVGTGMSWH